ncbi:MAG: EthD domain-containing protein [Deltaproteobacteria bacterium]
MRKIVFLCRRRTGLERAEYGRRILASQASLAQRHDPALRAYRVNLVDRARGEELRPVDSIAELSFDTMQDFRDSLYNGPDGRPILEADTAPLLGGADVYETTEYLQKSTVPADIPGGPTGRFKMIAVLSRPTGMTHEEFVQLWIQEHLPLALEHHIGLIKYVANVVDASLSPDALPLDGISELHFANEEAFRTLFYAHAESRAIIAADTKRFIGASCAWFVQEYCFR